MSSTVHLKNKYPLKVVSFSDVADNMKFSDDKERIIIRDIIRHLETKAGDTIKNNKTVLIPYIGSLRKSFVKQELRKNFQNLKTARTLMTKDEYKRYAKQTYYDCVDKVTAEDDSKRNKARLTAINRKKYNSIYKSVGEIFANTWIYSLSLIRVIEFNQEVEDLFKQLNNEDCNRKPNKR